MLVFIAWHDTRRCDNSEIEETGWIQRTSAVCRRPIRQSGKRLFVHHQTRPRWSIRDELRAENHRFHEMRCAEEKRICSCAHLVPAISRRRYAIRSGAHHHVQATRADGDSEQGSRFCGQLVSSRERSRNRLINWIFIISQLAHMERAFQALSRKHLADSSTKLRCTKKLRRLDESTVSTVTMGICRRTWQAAHFKDSPTTKCRSTRQFRLEPNSNSELGSVCRVFGSMWS